MEELERVNICHFMLKNDTKGLSTIKIVAD